MPDAKPDAKNFITRDITNFATRTALALILGLAATSARAAGASDQSQTVPIKLRLNTDEKKLVYSIPVHFGAKTLEAVLDTGSMPTLVLKGRIPPRDAQPTGATDTVTYGADRTYDSDVVQGPVRIGAASGTIAFGIVSSVTCVPAGSNCPVAGEGPHDARFAGLLPAIVGARLTTVSSAPLRTAFRELGVHRFVITAPRRGESDGTLQLDPNTNATSTFVPIYTIPPVPGVQDGSVRGCLRDKTNGASYCGAVFLDTGTTGIRVTPPSGNTQSVTWNAQDSAQLEFTDPNGAEVAGVDFPIDMNNPTQVTFAAPGSSSQAIIAIGQLPYIGLSILTDLDNNAYAVSPRPKSKSGIVGHVP